MTDREKLVELIEQIQDSGVRMDYEALNKVFVSNEHLADYLIAHGVTVREHGYLETVVEDKDNTVCGNGVKIEYKRCSCCKNPAKFFDDDFCGSCGAKLDLPEPPKGE